MQPSRIARDLMASGMDHSVHLAIVQASLCTLQRAINDLAAMQQDHDDWLRTLQRGYDYHSLKTYKQFLKDVSRMEEQVKNAPRTIIEILTRYLGDVKHHGHQKSSSAQEGKSVGGDAGEQRRSSV
ncbi:MAG: hypothetical protein Q9172_002592 [Xanthocarpia lactea]